MKRLDHKTQVEADRLFNEAVHQKQLGNIDEAIERLRACVQLRPLDKEAYFNLGNAYYSKGNDYQASKNWREALNIDPNYVEARINFGLVLRAKGKASQAIQQYQIALKADPLCTEAKVNLGVALTDLEQHDHALEQYKEVLELDPEHHQARFNLGLLLAATGALDEAVDNFKICIVADRTNEAPHKQLATIYKDQGKIMASIEEYLKTLDIDPSDMEANLELGLLLLERDKDVRCACHPRCCSAIPYLKAAASTADDRTACAALGDFEESLHNYAGALEYYDRILANTPVDKDVLLRKGICLRANKQISAALACFESILKIDPAFPEAHVNLSFLYAAMGEMEKAKAAMDLAAKDKSRSCNLGPLVSHPARKPNPFRRKFK